MTPQVQTEKPSDETAMFLSGKLHHVDINKIEKELFGLWQEASKDTDGQPSVTRACSMNLILFSTDDDAELTAGSLLDEITLRHPSRAILAIAHEAKEESLEAWVTARCHISQGKKDQQICCEQITVRYEGEGTKPLASVVLPLTLGDMPTNMVWQPHEVLTEMLSPFMDYVDRLIVDSSCTNDSPARLVKMQKLLSDLPHGTSLLDLNWRRLLCWRQSIARFFNEERGALTVEDLDMITSVRIFVSGSTADTESSTTSGTSAKTGSTESDTATGSNTKSGSKSGTGGDTGEHASLSQALLLAGWLASRLSWEFVSAQQTTKTRTDISFKLSRKKIDVTVDVVAAPAVAVGNVCRCEIRFLNRPEIMLVKQREGAPGLQAELKETVSDDYSTLTLSERSSSQLVADYLDLPSTGAMYKEVLAKAAEVAKVLK